MVSGERILSVGPATPAAVAALPAGTQVIAADGKWIVPGLIDAHVHAESDDDLKTMLNWGVTSVRLMAEDVTTAQKLARESVGRRDIPDVFPAAPIFTARGGWWDQGEPPDSNLNRFPSSPEEARRSVRKAKVLGAREIKLMLDDMGWCRDPKLRLARMKPEIAKALIDQARREGLRATVHAPNLSDAREAISDGATALAHGVLEPIDDATIASMKKRPVFYVPTMDIFEFLADTRTFVDSVLAETGIADRELGHVPGRPMWLHGWLLPRTVQQYRSREYSERYRERYPNFENVRRRLPALRKNLLRLHAAGVPVALGTDMWAFPGLAVSIEMNLYVTAGLTPLDAIRAATQTAASSLGLGQDRGTLEPGKRADFLVLTADPLWDVPNVRWIDGTWKAGVRVAPMSEQRGP